MPAFEMAGGISVLLIWFAITMAFNGLIFWILMKVMNYEGGTFVRCFWCSILLQIVRYPCLLVLFFPIPFINYLLWLYVWYKASNFVIEGTFDLRDGAGRSLLIAYILVSVALVAARIMLSPSIA